MRLRFDSMKHSLPYLIVFGAIASIPFRSFVPPECTKAVIGPMGTNFIFNCDSAQFMQDSQDIGRIFYADTSYQDRPLYALFAHLLSIFLRPFLSASETFTNPEGVSIQFLYANLLSFILLHFIVLFVGLLMLLQTIRHTFHLSTPALTAIIVTVFLNDVTKGFFWTPHTQIFSIYLVCYSFFSWSLFQKENLSTYSIVFWFLLSSVQIFFYPLLVLALLIPVAFHWKKYLFSSVLALMPYLIYPYILEISGGTYRNPQTDDFNQFVWVFEMNFIDTAFRNFSAFLASFSKLHVILIVFLLAFLRFGSSKLTGTDQRVNVVPILFFIVGYSLFLYFIGLYATRLTIPFLAVIIVFLLLQIDKRCSNKLSYLVSYTTILFLGTIFFAFQGTIS